MKLHEYQSKQLFAQEGIPIPRGRVAMTASEARSIAEELGGRAVVKSQVLVGGRGEAGGIRLVDSAEGAEEAATQVLGIQIKGLPVRKLLIDEAVGIQAEIYLGITNDRQTRSPVVIASAEGGGEIEEVEGGGRGPGKIVRIPIDPLLGLREYQARYLAAAIELPREHWRDFIRIASGLYRVFHRVDATLAEINPLVVTKDHHLMALDGKMVIDDNALFRHTDIAEMRDLDEEAPAEREARKYGLSYVHLDGSIGCLVNGGGLGMGARGVMGVGGEERPPPAAADPGRAGSAGRPAQHLRRDHALR